ncbi:SymE family type I addiction module toxin [Klebsiella electrica]|uniref:SymE family type I addiction module toxin n=1 Tax=Klebsiella electrica TaxID=1259973 RepID=UPI00387EA8A2
MVSQNRYNRSATTHHPLRVLQSGLHHAIFLRGEWISQAGFTDGMPIKIWVVPDCIVIIAQNTPRG